MTKDKRELLIDFFTWFRDNGEKYIGITIEEFVDNYLTTTDETN